MNAYIIISSTVINTPKTLVLPHDNNLISLQDKHSNDVTSERLPLSPLNIPTGNNLIATIRARYTYIIQCSPRLN